MAYFLVFLFEPNLDSQKIYKNNTGSSYIPLPYKLPLMFISYSIIAQLSKWQINIGTTQLTKLLA